MSFDIKDYLKINSWPFQEVEGILRRINYTLPKKGFVLFETGYGPSGLPHIGTFGEVVRTSIVQFAFELVTKMPTKLFCVSDDMDGIRKIPDTIANHQEYSKYIGLPLSTVPDPFGEYSSFGEAMNKRLRAFLDNFNFKYEFISATACYKNGTFNQALCKILENYNRIMEIMLPTLGPERRATYSPFMPICPRTKKVLQVSIIGINQEKHTISYLDPETQELIEVSILDGNCKLQWKPDFGMRWATFDVDFEMYGKEHLVNGKIYSAICQAIEGIPPYQSFYELFLDEKGEKISKTKGNGITIDAWLRYSLVESLKLFMYQSPQKAKRLYFDVIPKYTDEYLLYLNKYHKETDEIKRMGNPVFFIHSGMPPVYDTPEISYSLLLNIVGACNTDSKEVVYGYVKKFRPNIDIKSSDIIKTMIAKAIHYYEDFIKPNKQYRSPNAYEKRALQELKERLYGVLDNNDYSAQPELLQNMIYKIGNDHGLELSAWFQALYQILLGASQGPRFGSFIALYGIQNTIELIEQALIR